MPIVLHRSINRDTQMALWRIEETPHQLLSKLKLDGEEKSYVDAIKVERKKLQWLASRCIIRYLLATPDFIVMKATASGKPFFPESNRKISIAHSGNYAAAMISLESDVGLDIEAYSDKVMRVQNKFINESEASFIDQNDAMSLLVAWSVKESVFKWYGNGGVDFRKDITLHPFTTQHRGSVKVVFAKPDCKRLFNVEYEASPELIMSWLIS